MVLLHHPKKRPIFVAEIIETMKLFKLLILFLLLLAACGKIPQPNQNLILAYEYVANGEFDTAKIIADNAPRITAADSAMYRIIEGAFANYKFDWSYCDSIGIEKSINFFDGDDEKSAWAHLIKGVIIYNYGSWDDAVLQLRTAEKLAENTDCNELKFVILMRLAQCNINSYNIDVYDEVLEKLQKYAVTSYDSAEYYYLKCSQYDFQRLSLDSTKYYARRAVECIENVRFKNRVAIFMYYTYAELICNDNDSLAEQYIIKSFELDTLRQAYSVLGKIYLHRNDETTAKQYLEKSSIGNYWIENEAKINTYMHEFYAGKNDYKEAYKYAVKTVAAKDSLILSFQDDDVKSTQIKFVNEIENLKLTSAFEKKIFMIILIAAIVLAVLVSALYYQKSKLSERARKISEAQQTINSYNQKISALQQSNSQTDQNEISFLRQKVSALESKFSDIYVRGKELFSQILADKKIGRWSKDDYQYFIEYYQTLDFLFVYSFETDYIRLTDRQKVFLILQHIPKTKEQIMQIMTIEESSFRSMKSRIEALKNKEL